MADLEQAFEQWKTLAELQLQFVEKLGEHKLNVARSDLIQAVAAQHWAVARMKATVAKELETSLNRLHRQRHIVARHLHRLSRHAQSAAKISSGEDLSASQLTLMWAGYTVFERLAPATVLDELAQLQLPEEARDGSYFADPRFPGQRCPDAPPETRSVLTLIGWLQRNRLVPRRGTEPYRHVVNAFHRVASVAAEESQKLQQWLRALEQQTYDTWQPVVLAALPDSVDAKKIASLTAK